jgi:hypothetical protein
VCDEATSQNVCEDGCAGQHTHANNKNRHPRDSFIRHFPSSTALISPLSQTITAAVEQQLFRLSKYSKFTFID